MSMMGYLSMIVRLGIAVLAVPCSVQATPQSVETPNPPALHLYERFVSLRADGSNGHQIVVSVPTFASEAVAHATVVLHEDVWQVDEENCEPFKAAIFKFRELPPIRIGDAYLQTDPQAGRTLPASRKDGEGWRVRARGYTPDWSMIDVELSGSQGPYAAWLSDTVAVIKSCNQRQP